MTSDDGARSWARTATSSSTSGASVAAATAPAAALEPSDAPTSGAPEVPEPSSAPPSARASAATSAPLSARSLALASVPDTVTASVQDTVSAAVAKPVLPPEGKAPQDRSWFAALRPNAEDTSKTKAAKSAKETASVSEPWFPARKQTTSNTSTSSTAEAEREKKTASKSRPWLSAFRRTASNTSSSTAAPPLFSEAAAALPAKGFFPAARPWVSAIKQKVTSQPVGAAAAALLLLGVAYATRSPSQQEAIDTRQNPIENLDLEYDPDIEFDPEVSTENYDIDYDPNRDTPEKLPHPTGAFTSAPVGTYKEPCQTKMCELLKRVYGQVGVSGAEPCDDFFGYVCGSIAREDQKDFGVDDIPDIAGRYVDNYMRESFEEYVASRRRPSTIHELDYSERRSESERQMAMFFVSCLERNTSSEKTYNKQTFLDLFAELGIPLNGSSTNSVFSALVSLSTLYGIITPLLKFDIVWSMDRTDKLVSLSTMETPKRIFRHSPILMQAGQQPYVHYNPFEYNKEYIAAVRRKFLNLYASRVKDPRYKQTSNEDMHYVLILAKNLDLPWDKTAMTNVGLHYGIIKQFIIMITKEVRQSSKAEGYFLGNMGQLEEKTSTKWINLLNHNIKRYFHITNSTRVLVKNLRWVSLMSEMLMDSRFSVAFKHYTQVFVLGELAAFADLELEKKLCLIDSTTCKTSFPDELAFCRAMLKEFFPKSYLAKIGREMVHPYEMLKARAVNSFVALNFVDLLNSGFSWMDMETKQRVAVKIASMFSYVGFPDELRQDRAVEHKFRVRELFLQNVLLIMNARALRKLVLFNGFYERTTRVWPDHQYPAHRVSYNPRENSMVIPASVLTFPFFLESAPFWINVLTLGYNIAHQLFHAIQDRGGFDNMGRQLKSSSWSHNSIDKFKINADCFRRQIAKTQIGIPANLNFSDGFNTVDEMMADNGAFVLMITLMDHLQWQNLTQILPGINARFSMSQIRFLAPTLQFCYPGYRYRYGNDLVYSQPFDEWRFNEAVSNFRELMNSFQCHEDDRLVRKSSDRCEAWLGNL